MSIYTKVLMELKLDKSKLSALQIKLLQLHQLSLLDDLVCSDEFRKQYTEFPDRSYHFLLCSEESGLTAITETDTHYLLNASFEGKNMRPITAIKFFDIFKSAIQPHEVFCYVLCHDDDLFDVFKYDGRNIVYSTRHNFYAYHDFHTFNDMFMDLVEQVL